MKIRWVQKPLNVILLLAVLLGILTRFFYLNDNPAGFFTDEAIIGVDAYDILHTGKDSHHNSLDFLIRSHDVYQGFVQVLSTIPSVALFGLSEFSVRLPSAVYGLATIVVIVALGAILFHPFVGVLAAFFLAISPWHIHLSRVAFEVISFPFWFFYALFLFEKGLKKPWYIVGAFIAFSVALYSYIPARLIVPIFCFILIYLHRKILFTKKYRIQTLFSLIVFFVYLLPLVSASVDGRLFARYKAVGLTNLHLNATDMIWHFITSYLSYFSPAFLFSRGDSSYYGQIISRHSVSGIGLLLYIQIPLIVSGLLTLWFYRKTVKAKIIFSILLLYPLAGALTQDATPLATRGILGSIIWQFVSALGVVSFYQYIQSKQKRKIFTFFLVVGVVSSFSFFLAKWYMYPRVSAGFWGWQFGPKKVMTIFLSHPQYSFHILDGDFNAPDVFIPFYDPTNRCQNKCLIGSFRNFIDVQNIEYAVSVEKFEIYRQFTLNSFSEPEDIMSKFHIEETVFYPNGEPAFYVGHF